ncbi:MAG: LytR C-terminal domain-containing protein [Ignavibacteriae bacterium]|nr:LytR C-terminal domain-containing protein [Ignavibacteriota bacterium]
MKQETGKSILNYILNITIIVLGAVCIYLVFSLVTNTFLNKGKSDKNAMDSSKTTVTHQPNLSIQVDVQNGTGENRIGAIFRDYLKKKGYDVVNLDNYKSSDVERTIIIDRTGDTRKAQRIAEVLGVSGRNIIQQINRDLYLDATIVIGKDYTELKPYTEKGK